MFELEIELLTICCEQFGKCLLIKTTYKYARGDNKTVAVKTTPGIRDRLRECEQNFQVQCENSRLIIEATENGNLRGTN